MTRCPLCDAILEGKNECAECGKRLFETTLSPVPSVPFPELELTSLPGVETPVIQATPIDPTKYPQVQSVPPIVLEDIERFESADAGKVEPFLELTTHHFVREPPTPAEGPTICRYCSEPGVAGSFCKKCGRKIPIKPMTVVQPATQKSMRCRGCGGQRFYGKPCEFCGAIG